MTLDEKRDELNKRLILDEGETCGLKVSNAMICDPYIAIHFGEKRCLLLSARRDWGDGAEIEIRDHVPLDISSLHRLGFISESEADEYIKAAKERAKIRYTEHERREYERLKAKCERMKP